MVSVKHKDNHFAFLFLYLQDVKGISTVIDRTFKIRGNLSSAFFGVSDVSEPDSTTRFGSLFAFGGATSEKNTGICGIRDNTSPRSGATDRKICHQRKVCFPNGGRL